MKLLKALLEDWCDCGINEGCAGALPVPCGAAGIVWHTGQYYTEISSSFHILPHRDANEISRIKKKKWRYHSSIMQLNDYKCIMTEFYHLWTVCVVFWIMWLNRKERILCGASWRAWDLIHPSSFRSLTDSAYLGFEQTFRVGSAFLVE